MNIVSFVRMQLWTQGSVFLTLPFLVCLSVLCSKTYLIWFMLPSDSGRLWIFFSSTECVGPTLIPKFLIYFTIIFFFWVKILCAGGKRIDDHICLFFLKMPIFFCTKYDIMNRNEDNWIIRQDLATRKHRLSLKNRICKLFWLSRGQINIWKVFFSSEQNFFLPIFHFKNTKIAF